jgi:hypothetical protein
VLALHAPSATATNTATDVRASAWIRFLWVMVHLLCGSALEWAVLFGFHAHRELFMTGLVSSQRLLLPEMNPMNPNDSFGN